MTRALLPNHFTLKALAYQYVRRQMLSELCRILRKTIVGVSSTTKHCHEGDCSRRTYTAITSQHASGRSTAVLLTWREGVASTRSSTCKNGGSSMVLSGLRLPAF